MQLQNQFKNLDIYALFTLVSLSCPEIIQRDTFNINNVYKIIVNYSNAVKLFKELSGYDHHKIWIDDLWKKTKHFKVVQYYIQIIFIFHRIIKNTIHLSKFLFLFEDQISPLISSRLKDSTYFQIKLTPKIVNLMIKNTQFKFFLN
ncbi:unnamed protein product [Paramecium pentaurelia]|uniref:Uncharacterized protein n=1 Tax=Paramecium pentaurelia TaxID=43138 RepID=A0A8S1TV92_9CILI|nr:unnamed protein product [Paramecium pentaurelia]